MIIDLNAALKRVETGMATVWDAEAIRRFIAYRDQEIADLLAVIEKEINCEPKPEQKPRARQFDGAGTA